MLGPHQSSENFSAQVEYGTPYHTHHDDKGSLDSVQNLQKGVHPESPIECDEQQPEHVCHCKEGGDDHPRPPLWIDVVHSEELESEEGDHGRVEGMVQVGWLPRVQPCRQDELAHLMNGRVIRFDDSSHSTLLKCSKM